MMVSGVNPKGKSLVIKERGVSAFGNVYYSPDCVGNVVGPAIPGLRAVPDLVPIHPILPPTVHIHL